MKNLILILTLFIGLFSNAQNRESVLTISQIAHSDGHTYTHIKGEDNGAENCFVATSSSTLSMDVDGRAVDNIYYDDVPYSWTGYGGEALALSFKSWDDYNRIYRNRGANRPVYVEDHELLSCDGWILDASGQWYTNSAYAGYAYNSELENGRLTARLTSGYGTASNSEYFQYLPGFGTGTDGNGGTNANGLGIYFNNGNGFENRIALEAAILITIDSHMNPVVVPETGVSTPTANDEWVSGGIIGWVPPAGFDSAWSNAIYPGYAYSIDEWTSTRQYAQYNPHLIGHNAYVGVVDATETSGWRTEHIGTYGTNQEAVDAARSYISTRGATDSYETTAVGSYRIILDGAATYVEILTPEGFIAHFRYFSDYQQALRFAEDPGAYPAYIRSFTLADFVETEESNGWIRGLYNGGLHSYTFTYPSSTRNTMDVSWIYTDGQGRGHTNTPDEVFTVQSTTYYIHAATGDEYADMDAIRAAFPNNYNVNFDNRFTLLHRYTDSQIEAVRTAARNWVIVEINEAANLN